LARPRAVPPGGEFNDQRQAVLKEKRSLSSCRPIWLAKHQIKTFKLFAESGKKLASAQK